MSDRIALVLPAIKCLASSIGVICRTYDDEVERFTAGFYSRIRQVS